MISLGLLAVSIAAAVPDWLPGRDRIMASRFEKWNNENAKKVEMTLTAARFRSGRSRIFGPEKSEIILSGTLKNVSGIPIHYWYFDFTILDRRTGIAVLKERVRLRWDAPRHVDRQFLNAGFTTLASRSNVEGVFTELGEHAAWLFRFVGTVPDSPQFEDVRESDFGTAEEWHYTSRIRP